MISVERLERSGNRTWPALEEHTVGNWLLRAANGVTRRSNSVTMYGPPVSAVDGAVRSCEDWYRARRRPTIFRASPLVGDEVHDHLDSLGYDDRPGAGVMVTSLEPSERPPSPFVPSPGPAWWSVFLDGRATPVREPTMRRMLQCIDLPAAYVTSHHAGRPASVGSAVLDDDLVAIFNMRTRPALRRRGFARAVLNDLLAWGASNGASAAYLQVAPTNRGAIRLYVTSGFEHVYDYRYRTEREEVASGYGSV